MQEKFLRGLTQKKSIQSKGEEPGENLRQLKVEE